MVMATIVAAAVSSRVLSGKPRSSVRDGYLLVPARVMAPTEAADQSLSLCVLHRSEAAIGQFGIADEVKIEVVILGSCTSLSWCQVPVCVDI